MNNKIDIVELKLRALALRNRKKGKGGTKPCPPDEQFAAFMEGLLAGEEAKEIKEHILTCSLCHSAYVVWIETVPGDGPPVPSHLMESALSLVKTPVKRVILKLLQKTFEILNPGEVLLAEEPKPALSTLSRGDKKQSPNQYEIVDIKPDLPCLKSIRIQHLEDTGTVKLSLEPSAEVKADNAKRVRIDLYYEDHVLQSWPLSSEGVSLNPLEKGAYRLDLIEIVPLLEKHKARSLGSMELDLR